MLPRERVLALCVEHPGIARLFARLALVENAMLPRSALSFGRLSAEERLAHLLCELSLRLGGESGNAGSFVLALTREHIGDALGLTNVHVNRTSPATRVGGNDQPKSGRISGTWHRNVRCCCVEPEYLECGRWMIRSQLAAGF